MLLTQIYSSETSIPLKALSDSTTFQTSNLLAPTFFPRKPEIGLQLTCQKLLENRLSGIYLSLFVGTIVEKHIIP